MNKDADARPPFPWKDAAIPGAVSAAINAVTAWNEFKGNDAIALTVDSISSGSSSAVGGAVATATAMGMIVTLINFAIAQKSLQSSNAPSRATLFRHALVVAVKNTLFLFGLFVALAVVWQRLFGSITVGAMTATALTALIAGGVSIYIFKATRTAHAGLAGNW
jgi:hypothetical protein